MDKIHHIIGKELRGEITSEEKKELESWLINKANLKSYREIKQTWELTGKLSDEIKPDLDEEWNKFVQLRSDQKKPESTRIIKLNQKKRFFYYAAAMLIIAIGIFGLTKKSNQTEWITMTTGSETQEIRLHDGSVVNLNRNSVFSYPEKFSRKIREVELSGEAFFEVERNKAKFRIKTGEITATVLGTSFNIRAYPEEKNIELSVWSGKVEFGKPETGVTKIASGNEGIVYHRNSDKLEYLQENQENSASWKTGNLDFENDPLITVAGQATRYFNKVIVVDPAVDSLPFTGEFFQPRLEEFLEIITLSTGTKAIFQNDSVFIK